MVDADVLTLMTVDVVAAPVNEGPVVGIVEVVCPASPIVPVVPMFTVDVLLGSAVIEAPRVEVEGKEIGIVEVVWPERPMVPVVPMFTVDVAMLLTSCVPPGVKLPTWTEDVDGKLTVPEVLENVTEDVAPGRAVIDAPNVDVEGKFTVDVTPVKAKFQLPDCAAETISDAVRSLIILGSIVEPDVFDAIVE